MTAAPGTLLFLGAGASVPFGYPLTGGLAYALAWGVQLAREQAPGRVRALRGWLRAAHRLDDDGVKALADAWEEVSQGRRTAVSLREPASLNVVECLSTLDVLVAEGHAYGRAKVDGEVFELDASALAAARAEAVGAIGLGMARLAGGIGEGSLGRPAAPAPAASRALWERFAAGLRAASAVVTTNWDLIADGALHAVAGGTLPAHLGTDAVFVDRFGSPKTPSVRGERPPVYKIHGSLSWLACPRCGRLYVNEEEAIAHLTLFRHPPSTNGACDCGAWLNPLLVAPSYVKDYRNRHVRNVWDRALDALVAADRWTFAGYSLPADDIHIRALLRRALAMRADSGRGAPNVGVCLPWKDVDGEREVPDELARYQALFGDVRFVGPMEEWLAG